LEKKKKAAHKLEWQKRLSFGWLLGYFVFLALILLFKARIELELLSRPHFQLFLFGLAQAAPEEQMGGQRGAKKGHTLAGSYEIGTIVCRRSALVLPACI